ncbi:MAG: L-threonylcarbamoyladenylate synthase [Rothia sp. (in: high G+C Gram-positive bacteria)]|nr:L-threonylcarbamoyladenylate synthase [Rothia sp. (in: high G+C Gram-positive bacteria)]MDO5750767.1 L-threonylcarbamoyladenylate synthase [Rothia sp. (in: high G+C Gram-positive bacteria)]
MDQAVEDAREVLNAHGTVVIPTDTVYGIAADAYSHQGVAKLLADKGRGRNMPPPVLIFDVAALGGISDDVPQDVFELGYRFWPGALTLIVHAYPSISWDLGETRGTVAVRVPDDEFALKLLTKHGPLAVSSANKTGQDAATSAHEAAAQLGDDVALIIDAGVRPKRPVIEVPAADELAEDSVIEESAESAETVEAEAVETEAAKTESVDTAESVEAAESEEEFVLAPQVPEIFEVLPSTIVDCTSEPYVVVREGAISVEELREVVPSIVTRAELDAQNAGRLDPWQLPPEEPKAEPAVPAAPASSEPVVTGQEDLDEAYEQWDAAKNGGADPASRAAAPAAGSVAESVMAGVASVAAAVDQVRTRGYRNNTPKPVKAEDGAMKPVSVAAAAKLVGGSTTSEAE